MIIVIDFQGIDESICLECIPSKQIVQFNLRSNGHQTRGRLETINGNEYHYKYRCTVCTHVENMMHG